MIAVSYSRIRDFETCPRYFHHKYLLKSFKEDSEVMSSGLQQHKQLEDHVRFRKELPPHLLHVAPLVTQLRKEHPVLWAEAELAVNVQWKPVAWRDWDNVYIRAKLDLLGKRAVPRENELLVVDWKTGKVSEGRDQMRLNSAMAFTHYPDATRIHAAYIWTQHRQSDYFTVSRDEEASIREHFEERIDPIQVADQNGNWPPRPSGFCRRCSVSPTQCEYKQSRNYRR